MVSQNRMALAAMAAGLVVIWAQFAHVSSSSNDCTVVSQVLESCYTALQSATFFMDADSLCCKSLDSLQNRIREHELTRCAVCKCFDASDNYKQVFLNQNLLEVQTLCGHHVTYLITGCLPYADEVMNDIAALEIDFLVEEGSTKMTVVLLLTIMMELSTLCERCRESPAHRATNDVKECIKGCIEAWKIMEFVEIFNPKASLVSKHADRLFQSLKESSPSWLGHGFPIIDPTGITVLSAMRALQSLANAGQKRTNSLCIRTAGYDANDLRVVIAGNSLYKVCENIQRRSDNKEEMLDVIKVGLADVIWNCMSKVENNIMDKCKSWEEAFMEEMLESALYALGMVQGVNEALLVKLLME